MEMKFEAKVVIGKDAIKLSRVYLNRNGHVNSNNDDLANSNDNGRVVSFDERSESHAEGVEVEVYTAEDLEKAREEERTKVFRDLRRRIDLLID